jgi:outer membrane lipoprotein LolB
MSPAFLRKQALAAALPLMLGACASMAPSTAPSPSAQTQGARPYMDKLDAGGRLSMRYQNQGRDEAVHGNFLWTQTPARTGVTLLSPLGQTLAVITVTPDGATLEQAGQPVRGAADVDALVAEVLGWPLPISGLRGWLQGFALDANGNRFIATTQASEVVTRDGWRIRYGSWEESQPGTQLRPKRIDLDRPTAQAGDVSIRIVIDSWQASQ